MKNTILILISLLFLTGISEGKEIPYLQDRNGIKYEVNSETPYTGKSVKYYINGQKDWEGYLKNGGRVGLWTEWWRNGQIRSKINYKNGELDGLHTGWEQNGQKRVKGNWKNGERVGLWTWWWMGEKSREEYYKRGEKKEVSSLIDKEGLKYAQGDDEPYTGFFVRHYVNKQKKLQNYVKNGVLDGVMTMWYESGQKKSEGQSVNNQQEGLWIGWYENGQKSWEGNHKSGKQHGVYTEWDKEGNVTKTETYKDGELVK